MVIITPHQFRQRADFYHQLGQLTNAGLGLIPALTQLQRHPTTPADRKPLHVVQSQLAAGCTLAEALMHTGRWLPEFDHALIRAGEQSGRLDQCFLLLADYYTDRASIARSLLGDLAYPAFVLHFAVFIFPFPNLFLTGQILPYLLKTLGVLLPLYAIVFAGILAAQSRHGEGWRTFIEGLLDPLPVLGRARRELALARLCAALEALISAGVTIIEAWQLAAAASGSPALKRILVSWQTPLRRGAMPGELVTASRYFPEMFSSQYASAELVGKLDEVLKRLRQYYQTEGTRRLRAVAQWTPRLVYLLIALVIGYKVIQFYLGYFRMIGEAGGF